MPASQGVKPGEAVVDARGMIGRIFLAGDHTSWVILLTDLNSRIPVVIEPGNMQAIMAGDNSGAPRSNDSAQGARSRRAPRSSPRATAACSRRACRLDSGLGRREFRVALSRMPATSDDVRILDLKAAPDNRRRRRQTICPPPPQDARRVAAHRRSRAARQPRRRRARAGNRRRRQIARSQASCRPRHRRCAGS